MPTLYDEEKRKAAIEEFDRERQLILEDAELSHRQELEKIKAEGEIEIEKARLEVHLDTKTRVWRTLFLVPVKFALVCWIGLLLIADKEVPQVLYDYLTSR